MMSSFIRNLSSTFDERENAIKGSLVNSLVENVKEIQFECKERETDQIELCESTNSLCSTLEAFFLHGLKDSFISQTINVIRRGDVDRRPEPSFWIPILLFMHKQTIEQIQNLSQINSEVGNCRAWIRMSLNESLFSSYLNNIRKNNSALNPYYKKSAVLKDVDTVEVASKIMEGIEASVQMNLPINSTLLNRWPDQPLLMAGIWIPPIRSCPIASGIDIVSSLKDETIPIPTPHAVQCNELFSESISNSPFNQSAFRATADLTDKEHFEIFLSKFEDGKDNAEPNKDEIEVKVEKKAEPLQPVQETDSSSNIPASSNDSDLARKDAVELGPQTEHNNKQINRSVSMSQSITSLKSTDDRYSYNMLLVRHQNTREMDWNDVWERFESSVGITANDSGRGASLKNTSTSDATGDESSESANDNSEDLDFEILPQLLDGKYTTAELQEMVRHACRLSREPGLDAQGFVCKSCAHPLGIGFATAQVCAFTGYYYCENCVASELFAIPARITYNWDFRKYPVSKRAAAFLTEFAHQPFIDLKLINPQIYSVCEEMATLQSLRIRLNFIRAYLFTCCQPIIEELQKQVWPRDYLYEYIHRYSMSDLTTLQSGALVQLLQKIVAFGEQHILKCPLCSVKGFICEICNSMKVLYPFHLDTTFRCQICGAVYHDQCLNDSRPCPKCDRKRKREDLPLFEAIHML